MQTIFDTLKDFQIPTPQKHRVEHEFQELGLELQPIYGKAIWSLFYKKGFTEHKIREAHKIAEARGITKLSYLIGIVKKLK